ncbi:MAG: PIN domain-containing protein [Bifidobacteriaceae bacterium]|jgi:predicted nucleic acid-binding protein|nr:PIN domain-containing protein [Bifidobacteriaceae bacterium]
MSSAAESREFVDTNIWLYAYDGADARQAEAIRLLERLGEKGNGCLSVQVMQEFAVNALRQDKNAMSSADVVDALEAMAGWVVHRPVGSDIAKAVRMVSRHQLSFWDAMIVLSARQLGCAVLWSEDLNGGQTIEGVKIHNPFA